MRSARKLTSNLVALGILVFLVVERDWGTIVVIALVLGLVYGIAAHVRRQRRTRPLRGERHLMSSGERAGKQLGEDRQVRR
jgi:hypothetical protein